MDQHQEQTDVDDLYGSLPVGSSDIRVLILAPATCETDRIACKLECRSLNPNKPGFSEPDWESVSYTWESQAGIEVIWVNRLRRLITPNLAAFLRRRRDSNINVTLWVDAICINQADFKERDLQVPMMGKIYAASSLLNIWLGPERDDSDLAIDQLWRLGSGSPYKKMPILSKRALNALQHLLSRSWWSRVWILQEVLFGAMGAKLGKARVWCGSMDVSWAQATIAALRMQSHKDDMRQYFPNIEKILVLENLREQAFNRVTAADAAVTREAILELVACFRGCQSTNPRDKIYSLLGMLFQKSMEEFTDIRPNYTAPVDEVFNSFALYMLRSGPRLNILRHCHGRLIERLPSWAPDWSFSSPTVQLPYERSAFRPSIPWWIETFKDYDETDKFVGGTGTYLLRCPGTPLSVEKREREETRRFEELRLGSGGIHVVRSDSRLPKALQHLGEETQDLAIQLIASKTLMVFDIDERSGERHTSNPGGDKTSEEREEELLSAVLNTLERATERRTNLAIMRVLSPADNLFTTAAQTEPRFEVDVASKLLSAQGIAWDAISETQDKFPANIDADWQDATRFMVGVGKCKKMALSNSAVNSPYPSSNSKSEAFWLTMFAGQTERRVEFGKVEDTKPFMHFEHWLPEVPKHWARTEPRVTVTSIGRLEVADFSQRCSTVLMEYIRSTAKLGMEAELVISMHGVEMNQNLLPKEWDEEDLSYYTKQFIHLASLWDEQPYDLYHLPFSLPSTIPDPYWRTRAHEDSLALLKSKEHTYTQDFSYGVLHPLLDPEALKEVVDEHLMKSVSAIPPGTLEPRMEKYALGRKFFITKRGYFGLAPEGALAGDRVVVLFGLDVPLVCRKNANATYQVVGESYVHGLMGGEVIKKWRDGYIEAGMINLQ